MIWITNFALHVPESKDYKKWLLVYPLMQRLTKELLIVLGNNWNERYIYPILNVLDSNPEKQRKREGMLENFKKDLSKILKNWNNDFIIDKEYLGIIKNVIKELKEDGIILEERKKMLYSPEKKIFYALSSYKWDDLKEEWFDVLNFKPWFKLQKNYPLYPEKNFSNFEELINQIFNNGRVISRPYSTPLQVDGYYIDTDFLWEILYSILFKQTNDLFFLWNKRVFNFLVVIYLGILLKNSDINLKILQVPYLKNFTYNSQDDERIQILNFLLNLWWFNKEYVNFTDKIYPQLRRKIYESEVDLSIIFTQIIEEMKIEKTEIKTTDDLINFYKNFFNPNKIQWALKRIF